MTKISLILLLLFLSDQCQFVQHKNSENMKSKHKHTNRLIEETSPYLLQHAHNPVDWYPWGEEAFAKAKEEDKLVLVSIGYAACHWCHVMEHESFEDEEVAKIMNENFICIKVDREERPDVDHTYMDAVQIITGQGGWPLNCFTLPDGRPVYGGTYFRKEQWISILEQLSEVYAKDKARVENSAEEIMKGISKYNFVQVSDAENQFTEKALKQTVENWKPRFDSVDGGNEGAPKFPMPNNYLFLLKYFYFTEDADIKTQIELSLDKMAAGGIYDALGGGFARYSTDAIWQVPHFEKMLYDNAQLVSVYSQAYKLFRKEEYKKVVYETLAFIDRELTSPNGTFYSSIDADSEGEEGTFYIWKKDEIDKALKDDAAVFNALYGISQQGNWEHGNNVLHQFKTIEKVTKEYNLTEVQVSESLEKSKKILFEIRARRERPITDDKVLTSWNALSISAYTNAYRTFGDKEFLEKALKAAKFIKTNCVTSEGEVFRMARESSNIPGFLDDYSLLAQSFIDLYQATFDEEWLLLSKKITDYAIQHFYDVNTGMFFYSNLDEGGTITQKTEISDNVIPASNSVMAKVLYQLALYFEQDEYNTKARKMLNNTLPNLERNGAWFSNWASLLCNFACQPPEVVFTGKEAEKMREEFEEQFVYALVAGSVTESKLPLLENRVVDNELLIYVCRNRVCKLPVKTVDEALEQF
jgi:hypothetical protein